MKHFKVILLTVCLVFSFICVSSAVTPYVNRFWVPDGPVYDIEEYGNAIYFGGRFTAVGPRTGMGVPFDMTTGLALPSFPEFNSFVYAAAPDGAGGWFVAGDFDHVDNIPRQRLAHVKPDYTLDLSWNPAADGTVLSLALHNGKLYAAGTFHSIGGEFRDYFAELDAATGWATPFNMGVHGTRVTNMSLSGDVLYIAGTFDKINGITRNNAAAIDTVSGTLLNWDPEPSGGILWCLEACGNTVFAGGEFNFIGGQARQNMAALDAYPDIGNANSWAPAIGGAMETGISQAVYSIKAHNGYIYAAGNFVNAEGLTRNALAAYGLSTGALTSWAPDFNERVEGIDAIGDSIIAWFNASTWDTGGSSHGGIAAFSPAPGSGNILDWDPYPSNAVYCFAADGDIAFIGGSFFSIGMTRRNSIAAIDSDTGVLLPWNPGLKPEFSWTGPISSVRAIEAKDGTVYAAGDFNWAGGQPRQSFAALDPVSGLANSSLADVSGSVWDMKITGNKLYIAGYFNSVETQPRQNFAVMDLPSCALDPLNPGINGQVLTLAVLDNIIYAGGLFTQIAGQPRTALGAFYADTGEAASFNPQPSGEIYHIDTCNGALYMSGCFSDIGGVGRQRFAAADINGSTGWATAWNPGGDQCLPAFAVAAPENKIYIQRSEGLYKSDTITGMSDFFISGFASNNDIEVLKYSNGRLLMGGYYRMAGYSPSAYLTVMGAKLQPTPTCTPTAVNYTDLQMDFKLIKNYPNPFNGNIKIVYELNKPSSVKLSVYDIGGEKVYGGRAEGGPGLNEIAWDGTGAGGKSVASGVYIYSITAASDYDSTTLLGRIARIAK